MPQAPLKVTLEVGKRRELLEHLYPNGKLGGLVVEGKPPGALGRKCEVTIQVGNTGGRFFTIHGRLAWARHQGAQKLKECFGVELMARGEASRLATFARDESNADGRLSHRYFSDLQVKIWDAGVAKQELLGDLSRGGAFIKTTAPLPVATRVELDVRPPLSIRRLRLPARVVWVRASGPSPGMGLEFAFENDAQSQSLDRLVLKLEKAKRTEG